MLFLQIPACSDSRAAGIGSNESRAGLYVIAIVDDDESMRITTKDLLESAGFSAAVFARAASLLKSRRLSQVSCLIWLCRYLRDVVDLAAEDRCVTLFAKFD
jgi:hypothetical protein